VYQVEEFRVDYVLVFSWYCAICESEKLWIIVSTVLPPSGTVGKLIIGSPLNESHYNMAPTNIRIVCLTFCVPPYLYCSCWSRCDVTALSLPVDSRPPSTHYCCRREQALRQPIWNLGQGGRASNRNLKPGAFSCVCRPKRHPCHHLTQYLRGHVGGRRFSIVQSGI
jgi:hypothetical protein